ncbi:hypothetical protein PIROE2DRAFT_21398 [Piromyces sp. E2]|nr:hypothetical protein PIROE2DRAFT_21398 [Piromyces sp. E2]|eukprot:OUM58150.1 hypothetical protein PIROE2DRAFT_21398 [Piromyces sp. E2]
MIPNNSIYEAGFKSQLFTIVLISSSLIFTVWSLTRLLIKYSKNEENQKQINNLYQKCLDILNYYLDDIKYVEQAFNYLQRKYRHKQVYESVAVEDGLLEPCVKKEITKEKTIYCEEYYSRVVEKHKLEKNVYSDVSIYLTLTNGVTLSYVPKYPWYWDGVELFMGIQPNMKPIYNYEYLYPGYVSNLNIVEPNEINLVCETNNVKTEKEAQNKNQNTLPLSKPIDEEKKLNTLLLTKNNSLNTTSEPSIPVIIANNHSNNGKGDNENISVSIETKENNNINDNIVIVSQDNKSKNDKPISKNDKPLLKHSKSTTLITKEKPSISVRKSKSLPNLSEDKNSSSKRPKKQKFLKKVKHKKQPKIIYPSIPVNPDLSFVPLYKKRESKIERRVKHSDMENTYKKLKVEVQLKSK